MGIPDGGAVTWRRSQAGVRCTAPATRRPQTQKYKDDYHKLTRLLAGWKNTTPGNLSQNTWIMFRLFI